MNVVELDGKEFKDIEVTHDLLMSKLELPDYYGKNLDALWDCLTGWIDVPVRIKWDNYGDSYKNMGGYAEELKAVFEEAASENDEIIIEINF